MTRLTDWVRDCAGIVECDGRWAPCWARCTVGDRARWWRVFLSGLENFITSDKEANGQTGVNGESCDNDARKRDQK